MVEVSLESFCFRPLAEFHHTPIQRTPAGFAGDGSGGWRPEDHQHFAMEVFFLREAVAAVGQLAGPQTVTQIDPAGPLGVFFSATDAAHQFSTAAL